MIRFKTALAVVYVLSTIAAIAALWAAFGELTSWCFGAFACGLPHMLDRSQKDLRKNHN